eukprot:5886521-Pleurochrysis_carterae.AAC.1
MAAARVLANVCLRGARRGTGTGKIPTVSGSAEQYMQQCVTGFLHTAHFCCACPFHPFTFAIDPITCRRAMRRGEDAT